MGELANTYEKTNLEVDIFRAAYALNMCTVSVSQIIDYNDEYILEQEYDAILNNLNLENIPKDEALLKILTELLNTITFFRIQEIRKSQLENDYQQRMKNAIWSAIPNLSVVVSGSPVAMAMALATQVGIGYMNYRKEKANILSNKEKNENELQITAIEQFNALQRELFTTAWKLADKYGFPDDLRLTEKQIKQYNKILLDQDEYRKYARLEAIQEKFMAYPPFWYHFAHTALSITVSTNDQHVKDNYIKKAHMHFEQYQVLNKFNLLREDQVSASANLEYVELLFLDDNPDYEKINNLIDDAVKKAGNTFDILQMCALAYLRSGASDSASKLLKILVNEDYNAIANAKILSRLYVSEAIGTQKSVAREEVYSNYKILETRVDPVYLYPMPSYVGENDQEKQLEYEFISKQKAMLKKAYRLSLDAFAKQNNIEFNAVLPAPFTVDEKHEEYFSPHPKAKEKRAIDVQKIMSGKQKDDYVIRLSQCEFRYGFIDVLNNTVGDLEELSCFRNLDNHDKLVLIIEKRLENRSKALTGLQEKMNNCEFDFDDYQNLTSNYSYKYFTEDFFTKTKEGIMYLIDAAEDLKMLEDIELELKIFCSKHQLPTSEEYVHTYKKTNSKKNVTVNKVFFNNEMVGGSSDDSYNEMDLKPEMLELVKKDLEVCITEPTKVSMYFMGDKEFNTYFKNETLKCVSKESKYLLRQKTFAIIDDKTSKDCDMIFCIDGIRLVKKNSVQDCVAYSDIEYRSKGNKTELRLNTDVFSNKNIKIDMLKSVIDEMETFYERNC